MCMRVCMCMCIQTTSLGAKAEQSMNRAMVSLTFVFKLWDFTRKRNAPVYIFLWGQFIQEVFLGIRVELGGAWGNLALFLNAVFFNIWISIRRIV